MKPCTARTTENCLYSYLLGNKGELVSWKNTREMRCVCVQSGTHQQGPLILEQYEDQNHDFQKHIVVTFSAIVCLSSCPGSVWKVKSFQFVTLRETKLTSIQHLNYWANLLRFSPASALFVNNVFLPFILICLKWTKVISFAEYYWEHAVISKSLPASQLDLHYEQTATRNALVLCINSHVQCCSFNIYATIYEDFVL